MQTQPHEYWLKYCLGVVDLSVEQVATLSDANHLPHPPKGYLKYLRSSLLETRPLPFSPTSGTGLRWARQQRLFDMTLGRDAAVEARSLLGEHSVRPQLEMLIISGMPADDVSRYMRQLYDRDIPQKVVETYSHYFWNRTLLPIDRWFEVFRSLPRGRELKSCFSHGPEHTLWKLGSAPDISPERATQVILVDSVMRFMETRDLPNSQSTATAAKMWADAAFKAMEEARSADVGGLAAIVEKLSSIHIKLRDEEIDSVDKLKGEIV